MSTTTVAPTATARGGRPSPGPVDATRYEVLRRAVAERLTDRPPWVVLIELFIGAGWLRAAVEKAIEPTWWTGEQLVTFVGLQDGLAVGWYAPFLDGVVEPLAVVVALAVMVLQLVAGLALVSGRWTAAGLATGMFLNLHFVAAGAVNPSVFYLLAQGAVALWLVEGSASGRVDRRLGAVALGATTVAAASVAFVRTLHPHEVIEDPALMLVTAGVLTVLACDLALRQRDDGRGLLTRDGVVRALGVASAAGLVAGAAVALVTTTDHPPASPVVVDAGTEAPAADAPRVRPDRRGSRG